MSEILTPEQFDVQLQNIRWHAILGEDEMAASAEDLVRRHEHALRAERDRLAAEVERLRAATTWQPIETAPKDGTWIVAVGRLRHNPVMWRACVTRWSHYGPPVYAEGWSFSAPGYADLFDPEWWLPQPEPRAAHPSHEGHEIFTGSRDWYYQRAGALCYDDGRDGTVVIPDYATWTHVPQQEER